MPPASWCPRCSGDLLQNLSASAGDPNAVLSLNPSAHEFKPPRAQQWNAGVQHKIWRNFIGDIAYVGSKSDDLLRQVQINAVPFGATLAPQNQDPTRAPAATARIVCLDQRPAAPVSGYGNIRMWDYSGYTNYHALQTSITRRFDQGWSFSELLRLEQGSGNQQHRLFGWRPERERRGDAAARLLLT